MDTQWSSIASLLKTLWPGLGGGVGLMFALIALAGWKGLWFPKFAYREMQDGYEKRIAALEKQTAEYKDIARDAVKVQQDQLRILEGFGGRKHQ